MSRIVQMIFTGTSKTSCFFSPCRLIEMLLNNRMASIPCANRHSAAYTKDIPTALRHDVEFSNDYFRSSSPTAALQYFNMRVTQRLHRYRSLKRQWQEVATSIHYPCQSLVRLPTGNFSETNSPIHDAPRAKFQPKQRKITESKSFTINDVLNPNASNGKDEAEKIPIELDPLHTRIQQDLIKLRKFIRNKQGKSTDGSSTKTSSDRKYSDEMVCLRCFSFCVEVKRETRSTFHIKSRFNSAVRWFHFIPIV